MHFIYGFVIMAFGFLIVAKSEWMLNNFGRIAFFEQYLGAEGGTRLGYKLMGIFIIFIGFLFFTGMMGGFMTWMVSPLTKYSMPQ
jgi:hypothetical protein